MTPKEFAEKHMPTKPSDCMNTQIIKRNLRQAMEADLHKMLEDARLQSHTPRSDTGTPEDGSPVDTHH